MLIADQQIHANAIAHMKKLLVLITVAFVLFSFQGRNHLPGTSWKLVLVYDITNKESEKSDTLCKTVLLFKDSTYYGTNGSNDYFGKYSVGKGSDLLMKRPADSRVGDLRNCTNYFEKSLYSHYAEVEKFSIRADSLFLTTKAKFRLVLKKYSPSEE